MTKLAIVSGGFDPLHAGHVEMINRASRIVGNGGGVIVILNRDDYLIKKRANLSCNFLSVK